MKTVFIALNFHLTNTKSSLFFIDIIKSSIPDLIIVGANEAWYEIPRIKPDTIIIWQKIFSPEEIDSWMAKNVILIPMFDACPHTKEFWDKYKQYKIFCFSKTLYNLLKTYNFNTFYSQYYLSLWPVVENKLQTESVHSNNKLKVFFWERSKVITWEVVKKLLVNFENIELHYHYSTNISDKNFIKPTEEEVNKFSITFSDWFETQDDYKKIVEETDIYIAPRESEGIGLSFIEAIAAGCLVIAYDSPTMNEYIINNFNGLLFNENGFINKKNISNNDVSNFQKKSILTCKTGFTEWNNSIPNILDFINSPLPNYLPKRNLKLYFVKTLRSNIRHIYKKIKK